MDPWPDSPVDDLSEREREILELVAGGLSNREIAQRIRLTEKTVKHHMTSILHALHVRNRVAAALLLDSRNHLRQKGRTDRG